MKLRSLVIIASVILLAVGFVSGAEKPHKKRAAAKPAAKQQKDEPARGKLEGKNALLRKKLSSLEPKGTYIVVDTANNVLYLKKGSTEILKAVVSSGSGNVLQEPDGERKWVFDTPRGEFTVTTKLEKPDWIRPDWAFIEEGKNVPKNWNDRVESGVLGDYALGFGNGYFIHGTLYTRLLGRNVTHGCIRVADNDLKVIFSKVGVGTKIFIF